MKVDHIFQIHYSGGNNQIGECQIWEKSLESKSLPLTQPSQTPFNSTINSPNPRPPSDEVLLETPILEEELTTQQMQNQNLNLTLNP